MMNRSGFTFVEIIMVSLILVIIAGGFMTAFLSGQTAYLSSDASVIIQQESRRAFDAVVRELRQARVNAASAVTTNPDGSKQLNFQVARGYNLNATFPDCPVNDICWGSEAATTVGWVHYAIVGAAGNARQMIRCIDTNEFAVVADYDAATCRVLANNVRLNAASPASFVYDQANKLVTVNLQTEYLNTALPQGAMTSPQLTSQVRLRN